jgi:hypothetical protein
VHFEDTTPFDIVSGTAPGTLAAPNKSRFQSNLIALRVRANAAWCAARRAVRFAQNVNW